MTKKEQHSGQLPVSDFLDALDRAKIKINLRLPYRGWYDGNAKRPLIKINPKRHDNRLDLAVTLTHEVLHALGVDGDADRLAARMMEDEQMRGRVYARLTETLLEHVGGGYREPEV